MESFDELSAHYRPLIHKIIQSLNIYKEHDEFYQIGLIALWKASKNYDFTKSSFTTYAYHFIKGSILNELNKKRKHHDRFLEMEEEFWEVVEDTILDPPLPFAEITSYCQMLSEKEAKWLISTFIHQLTVKEIATNEHVSPSTVKVWKARAIEKLRNDARMRELRMRM